MYYWDHCVHARQQEDSDNMTTIDSDIFIMNAFDADDPYLMQMV